MSLLLGFSSIGMADDYKKKSDRLPLDPIVLDAGMWKKSLTDIKGHFDEIEAKKLEAAKLPEALKKTIEEGDRIKYKGVWYGGDEALEWLSSAKKGLRSPGGDFTLLDRDVGEVVIRARDGKVSNTSISIYNRGDDEKILKADYLDLMSEWKNALDETLEVRSESRNKSGVVSLTGWMWKKGDIAFLLEGSLTRKTNRPEFIRLRMASASSTRHKAKTASRRSLVANVSKKDGDVFVGGLPMVDQGSKGYCVVASVERVARYYGLNVDQHELAQLANTTADGGTSGKAMEKAFKKITGKIHVKTLNLMDYDGKQFERDVKTYNRQAKRVGAKVFPKRMYSAQAFWMTLDKDTFKIIKAKQPKFKGFQKNIYKWVDQGVPLCWTLYLGMFPEKEGSQSWGGHMRIIHGYNKDTDEILYTDSWGEGHEMKRMPAINAWCMTTGLYAMVPTN